MKYTKKCPVCNCTDIVRIPGEDCSYSEIQLNKTYAISVSKFLCNNCNYSEDWVDTKGDVQKLRKVYADIAKASRKNSQ